MEVCPDTTSNYADSSVDRALHIWANKGYDFNTNLISEDTTFKPLKEEFQIKQLRKYLMLDRDNTTFYLSVAQNIISAFPGISRYIKNNIFSKEIHEHANKPSPSFGDSEIVNDGNKYSKFVDVYRGEFPIPETYSIQWSSIDLLTVKSNQGRTSNVGAVITSSFGEPPRFLGYSLIRADWGDALPFTGVIKYKGFWNVGAEINVTYFPPSIDYKKWIEEIESVIDIQTLLESTGLYENYSLAKEPLEKLALLYALIVINYDTEIVNQ